MRSGLDPGGGDSAPGYEHERPPLHLHATGVGARDCPLRRRRGRLTRDARHPGEPLQPHVPAEGRRRQAHLRVSVDHSGLRRVHGRRPPGTLRAPPARAPSGARPRPRAAERGAPSQTHKLHTLPRWISSSKVEVVRKLLEDDPVSRARAAAAAPLSPAPRRRPCCSGRPWASPPTARTRRSAAGTSTPCWSARPNAST